MTDEPIERHIHHVRGQRVILDADLAALYGVPTHRLNEQVKRNAARFPADFAFQLTPGEWAILRSQIAISRSGHGGRRRPPFAFTEHGAIMAANVLRSDEAVEVSVQVVRAFIRLRRLALASEELALRIAELEARTDDHDEKLLAVLAALRHLMEPPEPPKRRIGFDPEGPN